MDTADAPVGHEGEPERRRSLSPSRAAEFKACALRYRFRVVDRLPEAPSPAAVRGTVVHRALQRIFDLPPAVRTESNAARLVEQAWRDTVAEEPDVETIFGDDDPFDAWLESCRSVFRRYFGIEDPRSLQPSGREEPVETVLDSGLLLRGIVDRIDVAPDGAVRIVDYKTGRAPGRGYELEALLQLRFYALVVWRERGVVPALLHLIYLGSDETISFAPDEDDLRATERLLDALGEAVAEAQASGDWRPQPGRACRFCSHHDLCPAYGGTPPPLPSAEASPMRA